MRKAIGIIIFISAVEGSLWAEEVLRIGFAGDAMCHRPQLAAAYRSKTKSYDYEGVFAPITEQLSAPDLMIANLETTLPGNPKQYRGFPLFGTPDSFAGAMKNAGVDVLATANNHCVDSFKPGLLRTIDVLREMGFHQLGTYASREDWESRRVLVIEKKGFRIALLNYTYSTNGIPVPEGVVVNRIDEATMASDLEAARDRAPDAILVIFHWGWEYKRYASSQQKRIAQFCFENGADVVLGAHPHVVQPFETRIVTDRFGETKQRVVLYSAGNFVSNMQRAHTKGGILFHLDLVRNPDAEHPQRLLFEEIGYQSTWVYRSYARGGRRYQLLPVDAHLAGKGTVSVPSYELSRMKQHARSNDALLAKGMAAAGQLRKSLGGRGPQQEPFTPPPVVAVAKAEPKPDPPTPPAAPPPAPQPPPTAPGDFVPGEEVQLTLKLTAKSSSEDLPSGNVLGLFEYEIVAVHRGHYPLKTIHVADGYAFRGRLTGAARRQVGTTVHMALVPLAKYPALSQWTLLADTDTDRSMIYTPKL